MQSLVQSHLHHWEPNKEVTAVWKHLQTSRLLRRNVGSITDPSFCNWGSARDSNKNYQTLLLCNNITLLFLQHGSCWGMAGRTVESKDCWLTEDSLRSDQPRTIHRKYKTEKDETLLDRKNKQKNSWSVLQPFNESISGFKLFIKLNGSITLFDLFCYSC